MVSNIILELNFLPSLNLTGVDIVELFWSQISWSEAVQWYNPTERWPLYLSAEAPTRYFN